jgi:hypothetical protein
MIDIKKSIKAAIFDKMWINRVRLELPDPVFTEPIFPQSKGRFNASLLPYNGTHLLATGGEKVNIEDLNAKRASDTTFDSIVTAFTAEVDRQSTKTGLKSITIIANDPAKPVRLMAEYLDSQPFTIADCFALSKTDNTFGTAFESAMDEIARQAGLTVS